MISTSPFVCDNARAGSEFASRVITRTARPSATNRSTTSLPTRPAPPTTSTRSSDVVVDAADALVVVVVVVVVARRRRASCFICCVTPRRLPLLPPIVAIVLARDIGDTQNDDAPIIDIDIDARSRARSRVAFSQRRSRTTSINPS
jgi:hypothetical protein